jgi:hypothetical protein
MRSEFLNVAGLAVNAIGTLLLLKFGLPPNVSPDGSVAYIAEQPDTAEVKKGLAYKRWGRVGMWFLFAGFVLQLLGAVLH